jgi:myo-inositol-1(or 4)-monophosphatase
MRGNLEEIRKTAVIAAKEAGRIILNGFGKAHKATMKSRTDIATEIDRESQQEIRAIVKKRFPSHAFLGEETPEIKGHSDYLWIVDPLDGTANYNSGIPYFCTSIACTYKRKTIVGVVFDPLHNNLFVAAKGKGAYLNNRRIKVSRQNNINRSLVGADSGHVQRRRAVLKMAKLVEHVRGIRLLGAAALSLGGVACGRLEAYMTTNTTAWDSAAGVLMVEEAGGKVTQINGKKRGIFSRSLLASNGLLHNSILRKITETRSRGYPQT